MTSAFLRRALWGLLLLYAVPTATAETPPSADTEPLVLLELFTSQGCSSCPPAETLLRHLSETWSGPGRLLPLAFHVDYWDALGWRDPFSDARWTERQWAYARRFGAHGVYTPQVVVNGRAECVGSDEPALRRLVDAAARGTPAVALSVSAETSTETAPEELRVRIQARRLRAVDTRRLDLVAVLIEDGLVTDVPRGENAGRRLAQDAVIRSLQIVETLLGNADGTWEGVAAFAWPGGARRDALRIVVFAQDAETRSVYGAAMARP